jgi:hypothetical protein
MRLHSITIHAWALDGMGLFEVQQALAEFLAFHGARLGYGGMDPWGDLYVEPSYVPLIVPTYIPDQRYMI